MPRTTKNPEPQPVPQPLPGTNGPTSEVLTLEETAAYLRLPASDVLRMVHEQGLPARQLGLEWRFLKTAVQQWLSTGSPKPRSSKEALLALAGKYKDDPDLMKICEEAYQRRGRPMTEDE
jgi:excisionase family DNA binding protein